MVHVRQSLSGPCKPGPNVWSLDIQGKRCTIYLEELPQPGARDALRRYSLMGIGVGLFLVALGAILTFAVEIDT